MNQRPSDRPIHPHVRTHFSAARLTVCIVLSLCLLATMIMIFLLSSESKQQSGDRSGRLTRVIVSWFVPDFDSMPAERQDQMISRLGTPVRKLAHMTEFGLLTILTALLMLAWDASKRVPPVLYWIIPAGFGLLCGAFDEFHQIFSHRGSSIVDVLIDFSGALLGLCLFQGIRALVRRAKRRESKRAV